MKVLLHITLILIISLIIGCDKANYEIKTENGIKHYYNKNTPNDNQLKIELSKLLEIRSSSNADSNYFTFPILNGAKSCVFDKNDNVYFINAQTNKILKYDKSTKHISSFGGKGSGPGEFLLPSCFAILNDTLYISDAQQQKVIRYNTNGQFIDNIITPKLPMYLYNLKNDQFIGQTMSNAMSNKGVELIIEIGIYNSKLEEIRNITKNSSIIDPTKPINPDMVPLRPFATNGEDIAIAVIDKNKYQIETFNQDGTKNYIISKAYKRIEYTEAELTKLNTKINNQAKSLDQKYNIETKYKNAISTIMFDNFNHLYVVAADTNNSTFKYDIFKNGIFLNSYNLPLPKQTQYDRIEIIGNKIVKYCENNTLEIYQINK